MKYNTKSLLAGAGLILAMLACNIPGTAPTVSANDQAATIIASTLTAQTESGPAVTATATKSAVPTSTSKPGATSTSPATVTITPTYSTPMLTVLQSTNCREGPGQDYQIIHTFLEKAKLEIIGRYDPTNFWLVKTLESKTGSCWMWGEYVEVTGSYWVVPTLTPPPTKTQPPPQAPANRKWDYFCGSGELTFSLTWEDRANNETSYRMFRDGEMVA